MGATEIWDAMEVARGARVFEIRSSSLTIDHSLLLPDMTPRIMFVYLTLSFSHVHFCGFRLNSNSRGYNSCFGGSRFSSSVWCLRNRGKIWNSCILFWAKCNKFFWLLRKANKTWSMELYLSLLLVTIVLSLSLSEKFDLISFSSQRVVQGSVQEMVEIGRFSLFCRDCFWWHHKSMWVFDLIIVAQIDT